jgi:hypothetical protein
VWGTAFSAADVATLQDEAQAVTVKLAELVRLRVVFTAAEGKVKLPVWRTFFTGNTFEERVIMLDSVVSKTSWSEAPSAEFWRSLKDGQYHAHAAQALAEMPRAGASAGGEGGDSAGEEGGSAGEGGEGGDSAGGAAAGEGGAAAGEGGAAAGEGGAAVGEGGAAAGEGSAAAGGGGGGAGSKRRVRSGEAWVVQRASSERLSAGQAAASAAAAARVVAPAPAAPQPSLLGLVQGVFGLKR